MLGPLLEAAPAIQEALRQESHGHRHVASGEKLARAASPDMHDLELAPTAQPPSRPSVRFVTGDQVWASVDPDPPLRS
jgi:hypothetical protein